MPIIDFNPILRHPNSDDQRQWERLVRAIEETATQILAWGELLRMIRLTPDIETLYEMADGMSRFEAVLVELDTWLMERTEAHWVRLQRELHHVYQSYRRSGARESLSTYLQWRADAHTAHTVTPRVVRQLEQERFRAGDGMITLAVALRTALRSTKAMLA